jgi:hypothetical protein
VHPHAALRCAPLAWSYENASPAGLLNGKWKMENGKWAGASHCLLKTENCLLNSGASNLKP